MARTKCYKKSCPGAVLGKNIGGRGLAPHHLGGNNEQNYCDRLSSIKQLMYNLCIVITLKIGGGKIFGGLCPPGPNIEPQLTMSIVSQVQNELNSG